MTQHFRTLVIAYNIYLDPSAVNSIVGQIEIELQ